MRNEVQETNNMTVMEAYGELLKAITGYDLEFYQLAGDIIKVEDGNLCFYADRSYHGSSHYEKYNTVELSLAQANALEALLVAREDIVQTSAEKQMEKYKREKAILERKMKDLLKGGKIQYERCGLIDLDNCDENVRKQIEALL